MAASLGSIVGTLLLVIVFACIAQPGMRYNRDVYPGLRAAWEQSWLCHRCGTVTRIQ